MIDFSVLLRIRLVPANTERNLVDSRYDSIRHEFLIRLPHLSILRKTSLIIIDLPWDKERNVIERIEPGKDASRREPTGQGQRNGLHDLPEVIHVSAITPPATTQKPVVRARYCFPILDAKLLRSLLLPHLKISGP